MTPARASLAGLLILAGLGACEPANTSLVGRPAIDAPPAAPTARPEATSLDPKRPVPRDVGACHGTPTTADDETALPPCDPCAAPAFKRGAPKRASAAAYTWGGFHAGFGAASVAPDLGLAYDAMLPEEGAPEVHLTGAVPAADLDHDVAEVRAHHCCDMRSKRFGVPDEEAMTISVCRPDLTCAVTRWANEWNDSADGRACIQAGVALREAVKRAGKPVK